VDHSNNVWITTSANSLVKYDGSAWTTFNSSNSCIANINSGYIAIDNSNNVWLSDGNFGFILFDGTTCTSYPHPTMSSFSGGGKLVMDIDGSIWQNTLLRIVHFDGVNWNTFTSQNSPIQIILIPLH
jgi:streptogramin lyase